MTGQQQTDANDDLRALNDAEMDEVAGARDVTCHQAKVLFRFGNVSINLIKCDDGSSYISVSGPA